MKHKNIKKQSIFQTKAIKNAFTGNKLTKYAGLSPIMSYITKLELGKELNDLFPTTMTGAAKFTNVQVLLSYVLSSLAGVNRIKRIANFTADPLVMQLLGLVKNINKDALSTKIKELGKVGAIKLQEFLFVKNTKWIARSGLSEITLDADSTVCTVYGNQEGAAKGFNPQQKGAKSYHPLLIFASEMKLVLNSWFRTGSAYTSNGICEFMKQTLVIVPQNITKVFFRADSGFFNGELFDLLEEKGHTYLVKVKLKNIKKLLESQKWKLTDKDTAICEFEYKCHGWKKSRKLKAIRTVAEWVEARFLGEKQLVPKYSYACYCSNLEGDATFLHHNYKQRSTSETWIEQVKSQLLAGKTLTDSFDANDIIWQLNVFAYNISVMMRCKVKRYWSEEHSTFRDWFINLPAKLVKSGRQLIMKIYEHYYYRTRWRQLELLILQ